MITRRQTLSCAAAYAAGIAMPSRAQPSTLLPTQSSTQSAVWPRENVKLIVPFAAGGGTDRLARLMGQRLSEKTGKSFVIENRPGAGGNLGAAQVAQAKDPHQLLFTTSSIVVSPFLYAKPGYNLSKDLSPIVQVSSSPLVLVVKTNSPIKAVSDLPATAQSKSGGLNYASPGIGTTSHLGGFLLSQQLKIQATHVAYRGAGPAVNALIAGEIDFALMAAVAVLPFIKNQQLRAVAVAGSRPLPDLATTPLLGGAPYKLELDNWQGVLIASNLLATHGETINRSFNEMLKLQDVRTTIYADGATPAGGTSAQFKSLMSTDGGKYGGIVIAARIKPE
jgi:tripartite-type tricarboxylate transporter receptor subunit TctC